MPRYDGTGPTGGGPQTGRGFGPCSRGFRRGPGYAGMMSVALSKEEQKKILEAEKQEIEKRLKELED